MTQVIFLVIEVESGLVHYCATTREIAESFARRMVNKLGTAFVVEKQILLDYDIFA